MNVGKSNVRKSSARGANLSVVLFSIFGVARPLPACPAGETVRRIKDRMPGLGRPLPARPAGEAVPQSSRRTPSPAGRAGRGLGELVPALLAAELFHLPDEPAGVLTLLKGG